MKRSKLFILILTVVSLFAFAAGCGGNDLDFDTENSVKVVFELEGGLYQNSECAVVQYYAFKPGTTNLIKDLEATRGDTSLNEYALTRASYTFVGWYTQKTGEGDDAVYGGKQWNFAVDRVGPEGVTLYAKWEKNKRYTYQVYYRGDDGELVKLGEPYKANAGDKFEDWAHVVDGHKGYTFVRFTDEEGNPWNDEFVHPGGEGDLEIKVIAEFEKGVFANVSNKDELIKALDEGNDIRLTADIDFEGEDFGGFKDFHGILNGNGHKISNFKLTYGTANYDLVVDSKQDVSMTLAISLFGRPDGAEVSDVSFEGVVMDINTYNSRTNRIVIAPLCDMVEGAKFTNVTVKATYTLTRLPDGFDKSNIVKVTDEAYYDKDDESVFDAITVVIDDQINTQE